MFTKINKQSNQTSNGEKSPTDKQLITSFNFRELGKYRATKLSGCQEQNADGQFTRLGA